MNDHPAIREARAALARLGDQRLDWEAAVDSHKDEIAELQAQLGAAAVDDPAHAAELLRRVEDLRRRNDLAARAIAELHQREEAARKALTTAQAQALREQAQALRAEAEALDGQVAPLLAQLAQLQGCAYVPDQPPPNYDASIYGPRSWALPRSEALRMQAAALDRQAADLARALEDRPPLRLISSAA